MARSAIAKRRPARATVSRSSARTPSKLVQLQQRAARATAKTRAAAARNEQTLLTLAGAGLPAGLKRAGVDLPTLGQIDPALVWGAGLMFLSTHVSGRNGERLFAIGTGMTAPSIARGIETGTVKVSGDGEDDDDDDDDLDEDDDGI